MILPKKVANGLKINLAALKNASPFYVEKQTITYEGKRLCSAVFSTKKRLLSRHQSAIRESPTVFSRLPSLMVADKQCPPYGAMPIRPTYKPVYQRRQQGDRVPIGTLRAFCPNIYTVPS